MERVKEPELMDSPEQSEAYAGADFSASEEALINGLGKYLQTIKKNVDQTTLIVDLGCGPGNISGKIAMRWPSAHVLGIDGSLEMLKIARKRSKSSAGGLNRSSLSYELASLKSIIKKSDEFNVNADIVISNSVLHHVHDPSEFWNGLKSGTMLNFILIQILLSFLMTIASTITCGIGTFIAIPYTTFCLYNYLNSNKIIKADPLLSSD